MSPKPRSRHSLSRKRYNLARCVYRTSSSSSPLLTSILSGKGMTGVKYVLFSSSSTFSSSETSSMPVDIFAWVLAGLLLLNTKLNSFESNCGILLSVAGFGCVVDGAPNEKLNVDEPKADELAAFVICGVPVALPRLPKLNVGFGAAAETEKLFDLIENCARKIFVNSRHLPFEVPKAFWLPFFGTVSSFGSSQDKQYNVSAVFDV